MAKKSPKKPAKAATTPTPAESQKPVEATPDNPNGLTPDQLNDQLHPS